jgi:hypothetical protein
VYYKSSYTGAGNFIGPYAPLASPSSQSTDSMLSPASVRRLRLFHDDAGEFYA